MPKSNVKTLGLQYKQTIQFTRRVLYQFNIICFINIYIEEIQEGKLG